MVWIANWKVFDGFIMFLIAINSILLGLMDYTPGSDGKFINILVNNLELPFLIIFTLEMVIKVIANGLIMGKKSYLADAWNWIDFSVVITGIFSEIFSGTGFSGLRTFRLFRPLRSLGTLKNMCCLLYTSPSPRDLSTSRMPSSA